MGRMDFIGGLPVGFGVVFGKKVGGYYAWVSTLYILLRGLRTEFPQQN